MEKVSAWPLFVLVAYLLLTGLVFGDDDFHEELLLRPLPSGHLHAHFQFTTAWHVPVHGVKGEYDNSYFKHYHLFPKALGEIVAHHKVQELHLTLTMGLWKTRDWGYPLSPAPPGVELWAWFHPSLGAAAVDETWKRLVNALSGLSCSSLNFLDKTATVSPVLSFRPTGAVFEGEGLNSTFVRYGALPREVVCTENLTPWKKLLPCESKAGLATLLNDAKRLFDSAFHSLSIHLRPVCRDEGCAESSLELTQSLSVVYDPFVQSFLHDWSMKRLFGKLLTSRCPLAKTSSVMVEVTSNGTKNLHGAKRSMQVTPPPSSTRFVTRGGAKREILVYDLRDFVGDDKGSKAVLNVACKTTKSSAKAKPASAKESVSSIGTPDLHASRHVIGTGQHRGGVAVVVHNNADRDATVLLMETVPWYLRTFYHTLQLWLLAKESQSATKPIAPLYLHYLPSKDNERSTLMELAFTIPSRSSVRITYEFEKAFLKWTAYPPDANHGFYVASSVITAVLFSGAQIPAPSVTSSSSVLSTVFDDGAKSFPVRIYADPLLVTMPTPDFSMPYNVICLVSTAVAIAFGTIHNQATRSFVRVALDEESDGTMKKILTKIKDQFWKKKAKGEEANGQIEKDEDKKEEKEKVGENNKTEEVIDSVNGTLVDGESATE